MRGSDLRPVILQAIKELGRTHKSQLDGTKTVAVTPELTTVSLRRVSEGRNKSKTSRETCFKEETLIQIAIVSGKGPGTKPNFFLKKTEAFENPRETFV